MNNYPYPSYYQSYPNFQQQLQQPVMPQPSQAQNQILAWVQSEEEGTNYPLNAGQSIFLMNQRADYLYMKSVDQLGKVTFIKKRLVDETEPKDSEQLKDYMKREEFESLISDKIEDLVEQIVSDKIKEEVEKKISEISFKPTKKKTNEED